MKNPRRFSLTAVLACGASPLMAAAFTQADFGAQPVAIGAGPRALGMGGAFSAVADDATACTWNPAGLTQLERPEVAGSLGGSHTAIVPESGDHTSQNSVKPEHFSFALPYFAFGCQQTLGLAWQRQYEYAHRTSESTSSSTYDDPDAPSILATDDRQATAEQDGALSTTGLCYAIEARPGLSFGLTLNLWADRWTGGSHYRRETSSTRQGRVIFLDYSNPDIVDTNATSIVTEMRVTSGTSLVLGTMWQATPALNLAVVFKPGYTLGLEADTHVDSYGSSDGVPTYEDHAAYATTATLHHPPSLTVGGAWRQADTHTFTCDFTWTWWSQYYLEDERGRRNPVFAYLPPDENRDLWTLRAGYEYVAILPRVILVPRVGVLVELLPAASELPLAITTQTVEATADRWLGLTAGLSLCQRQVIWDIGAQVRHGENVAAGQYTTAPVDMTMVTVRLGVTWQF